MAEMSYKEEFIKIYKDNIKRQGADSVLAWLKTVISLLPRHLQDFTLRKKQDFFSTV